MLKWHTVIRLDAVLSRQADRFCLFWLVLISFVIFCRFHEAETSSTWQTFARSESAEAVWGQTAIPEAPDQGCRAPTTEGEDPV